MIELNKIYNEDCLEGIRQIDDKTIDLIVTDPPYLINYKTNRRQDKSHKFTTAIENDDNPDLIVTYIKECYRILKDDSAMYMFCNADKVEFFKKELNKFFNVKNMIIWVKNNHTAGDLKRAFGKKYEIIFLVNKGKKEFNGKRLTDVWNFDRVVGNKQIHQNQKPLDLITQCVVKHSAEGDVIFDGFMGSGTTAIACINTNRNFIGFETDKEYFYKSIERIKDHKKELETD
ncbi:DNA-methyltransferase [Listeria welshimeri]